MRLWHLLWGWRPLPVLAVPVFASSACLNIGIPNIYYIYYVSLTGCLKGNNRHLFFLFLDDFLLFSLPAWTDLLAKIIYFTSLCFLLQSSKAAAA